MYHKILWKYFVTPVERGNRKHSGEIVDFSKLSHLEILRKSSIFFQQILIATIFGVTQKNDFRNSRLQLVDVSLKKIIHYEIRKIVYD